jgi:hypothetical protein
VTSPVGPRLNLLDSLRPDVLRNIHGQNSDLRNLRTNEIFGVRRFETES